MSSDRSADAVEQRLFPETIPECPTCGRPLLTLEQGALHLKGCGAVI